MMAEKLPVIGHWTCPEGGRAEVTQTRRAGKHFNTRCDCCGYSQATGAKRQQSIWDRTEWVPGVTAIRPANVQDTQAPPVNEPTPEAPSEPEPKPAAAIEPPAGDFDPGEVEPEEEEQPEAASKPWGALVAGGVFLGSAIAAALWNI